MNILNNVLLQVAAKAVVIDGAGKIFIVREATTGESYTKVGLPAPVGGRLNPGELFSDSLNREVAESGTFDLKSTPPDNCHIYALFVKDARRYSK